LSITRREAVLSARAALMIRPGRPFVQPDLPQPTTTATRTRSSPVNATVGSWTTPGVHQEFTPYGPARPAHRQVVEFCFDDIARSSPRLLGVQARPSEIRVAHQPGDGVD
jgi:hypothetical protein